jgi:hypothetical protein
MSFGVDVMKESVKDCWVQFRHCERSEAISDNFGYNDTARFLGRT